MAGFYENSGDPSNIFTPTAKEEADRAEAAADRADAAADGLESAETNAAASAASAASDAASASTSETNAATSAANASTSETNAATSETNAANSASAASTSESNAATSASNASTSETNAATSASNASTSETNAAASASAAATSESNAATSEANALNAANSITNDVSASRNQVVNQDPLSQGEASRNGIGIRSYTGNGTSQSINVGVDLSTGDFGGLVWVKSRDAVQGHVWSDSVRGVSEVLQSNTTAAELTDATSITGFTTSGFSVGVGGSVNTNGNDHAAWCLQTTKIATGVTNRNKPYTCHFNPDLGFSITGYEGDGSEGHEIPHNLGRAPDLSIFKDRDAVANWTIQSSLFGLGDFLEFDTGALATDATTESIFSDLTVALGNYSGYNPSGRNVISYHFANTPGLIKVGKYIGTGAAGNYVSTESEPGKGDGFKPAFIMIKRLSNAASWEIWDVARDAILLADTSGAEFTNTFLEPVNDGFVVTSTSTSFNAVNDEYLFLAIAESAFSGGIANTTYDYATTPDQVTINQDTLISFAEGFNANGEVNVQENVGAGVTFTVPASNEDKKLYLYKDKAGAYGVTEYRPLEEQDYFGVQSPLGNDVNLRTTAKHFDYESSTGVASASGERTTGEEAYRAFDKDFNQTWQDDVTTGWLQYKFSEPRVLKSWRFLEPSDATRSPRRFTIEGSNDGLNWTAVDSAYTTSDYVGNGANLWGDLQDVSANTTAYLYYRIDITANNGSVDRLAIKQLELNTITPSDRYDVVDGKMYDSAGSPISRVYLGEFRTDGDGDIIAETLVNYTPAKRKVIDEEVHGDLIVHGEIANVGVATAMVTFDGTQNPPLILNSVGIADVIDLGTGNYAFVPEDDDYSFDRVFVAYFAGDSDFIINRSGNSTNRRLEVFARDVSAGTLVDVPFASLLFYGGND